MLSHLRYTYYDKQLYFFIFKEAKCIQLMHACMKVCIFSTCIVDLLYPDVGKATVELLQRFGCETFSLINKSAAGNQPIIAVMIAKQSLHLKISSMPF